MGMVFPQHSSECCCHYTFYLSLHLYLMCPHLCRLCQSSSVLWSYFTSILPHHCHALPLSYSVFSYPHLTMTSPYHLSLHLTLIPSLLFTLSPWSSWYLIPHLSLLSSPHHLISAPCLHLASSPSCLISILPHLHLSLSPFYLIFTLSLLVSSSFCLWFPFMDILLWSPSSPSSHLDPHVPPVSVTCSVVKDFLGSAKTRWAILMKRPTSFWA